MRRTNQFKTLRKYSKGCCDPCCNVCCNPCCCPGPCPSQLIFYKIDAETGAGLPGALFEIRSSGVIIASAYSEMNGRVCFDQLPPGTYVLAEVAPPPGYQPVQQQFIVTIDDMGNAYIDGIPAQDFRIANIRESVNPGSFTAIKIDTDSGERLSGAVYSLTSGGTVIATAVSDFAGRVTFSQLPPGAYVLTEVQAPPGYIPVQTSYTVIVSEIGTVTIDGIPANNFLLENRNQSFNLAFTKIDSVTLATLPGAAFTLSSGGIIVGSAVSDASGRVNFGLLAPGTYTLVETAPPPGYASNPTPHTVVVDALGNITIDGVSLAGYLFPNIPL